MKQVMFWLRVLQRKYQIWRSGGNRNLVFYFSADPIEVVARGRDRLVDKQGSIVDVEE